MSSFLSHLQLRTLCQLRVVDEGGGEGLVGDVTKVARRVLDLAKALEDSAPKKRHKRFPLEIEQQ